MPLVHPLEPVWNAESKILILGSFPSVRSREAGFTTLIRRIASGRFWPLYLARIRLRMCLQGVPLRLRTALHCGTSSIPAKSPAPATQASATPFQTMSAVCSGRPASTGSAATADAPMTCTAAILKKKPVWKRFFFRPPARPTPRGGRKS